MIADRLSLSHAAVDILWEDLALGAFPTPFEIPSVGVTADERAAVRRGVWAEVTERGLARRGRLEPEVEDRLAALVRFRSAVSLFGVVADGQTLRARVSGNERFAVLATQDETSVHIDVVEPHRLIASILGVLPAARPYPGRLVKVFDDQPGSTRDDEAARRMLAAKRERAGYFTAYGLDPRGRSVRSPELAWTDSVRGRFVSRSRTAGDGTRFTTHEPGSYPIVVTALRELVAQVRADQS